MNMFLMILKWIPKPCYRSSHKGKQGCKCLHLDESWVSEDTVLESSYFQLKPISELFSLNTYHLPKVVQWLQGEAGSISMLEASLWVWTGENRTWHLWLMAWRNRHYYLDLHDVVHLAMDPNESPSFPWESRWAGSHSPLPQDSTMFLGKWTEMVHTESERQRPAQNLQQSLMEGNTLADCLSPGLSETDIAAHLSKKNLSFQHRGSQSKRTKSV